jgi:hypothetical protein
MSTIRASNKSEIYIKEMSNFINDHTEAVYLTGAAMRWCAFRVNVLTGIFVIAAAIAVVCLNIDAPLAGFVLLFALEVSQNSFFLVRYYTEMEL